VRRLLIKVFDSVDNPKDTCIDLCGRDIHTTRVNHFLPLVAAVFLLGDKTNNMLNQGRLAAELVLDASPAGYSSASARRDYECVVIGGLASDANSVSSSLGLFDSRAVGAHGQDIKVLVYWFIDFTTLYQTIMLV
jgi:hypothetical protein